MNYYEIKYILKNGTGETFIIYREAINLLCAYTNLIEFDFYRQEQFINKYEIIGIKKIKNIPYYKPKK